MLWNVASIFISISNRPSPFGSMLQHEHFLEARRHDELIIFPGTSLSVRRTRIMRGKVAERQSKRPRDEEKARY